MNTILTLDPGKTSGYLIAVHEEPNVIHFTYGERKLTPSALYHALLELNPHYFVCEDFEYRNKSRMGLDLTPVKLIGVAELYAEPVKLSNNWSRGTSLKEFYLQSASTGKAHFSDEKIKELGIYKKGVNHGRDACRHFLQWLRFGPGYKLIENDEPVLNLVDESWLLGAYWAHIDPWSHY